MNWRKTQEFYLNEGYILPPKDPRDIPKPGTLVYYPKQEQLELDRWESKVMEKDGTYRKRPNDPTIYPLKRLVQLKRVRWIDGKEYLKSFWEFIGVNYIGNRETTTIQDHEVYIKPEFVKKYVINKETGEQEQRISEVLENEKIFTAESEFSPEKVDEYLKGQMARRVALSVAEETETGAIMPRQVINLEAFKNSSFESLAYAPLAPQPQQSQPEPANAASARKRT